jgi:hypothetical protein
MDSLRSILHDKDFDEPPEIASIKKFVQAEFGVTVGVSVNTSSIIISVPSSAMANSLRLRSPELKRRCQLDKRLTFRIGPINT